MATDPVCGMAVDEKDAIKIQKDNKTFYFCSSQCKDKFLSAPVGAQPKENSTDCCS